MQNVRLIIQYDGCGFAGWQIQPNQRTVQGVLEAAIAKILGGREVRVAVAGRTDSGVHARAQVVSFPAPFSRRLESWVKGLNKILPEDVSVMKADFVPLEFDPRRWAHGKRYVYRIWNGSTRAPLLRRYAWEVFQPLNLDAMAEAATALVGEHDFASFQAAGCAARTTVRVVEDLRVEGYDDSRIEIDIKATAFLRHMVRNIVGTLVEVGLGRREPGHVPKLILARDRALAGQTAPAHGLTLEEVYYGDSAPQRRLMDGSSCCSAKSRKQCEED